jgi:hypothetical protein
LIQFNRSSKKPSYDDPVQTTIFFLQKTAKNATKEIRQEFKCDGGGGKPDGTELLNTLNKIPP